MTNRQIKEARLNMITACVDDQINMMMYFPANIKVFDAMPEGWGILEVATTAPSGYVWIWNRKSRFSRSGKPSEYKHGLLKI